MTDQTSHARSILIVLLVVIAAAMMAACDSKPDKPSWREYKSTAGGYTVQMPGDPRQSTESQDSPAGVVPVPMAIVDLPGQGVCMVGYADYPPWAASLPVEQLLSQAAQKSLESTRSTFISQRTISLDGYQGVEVEMKPPEKKFTANGRAISRLYWVPPRLYMAIIAGPESEELFTNRSTFLDSFKLLAKP